MIMIIITIKIMIIITIKIMIIIISNGSNYFKSINDHDYRSIDPGPFSLLGNIIAPKPNALLAGPARADVEDGEGMTPTVKVMTMSMFGGSCVKMETMPMVLKVFNGDR